MNKYLIFRTDRIGDFLITAILVNSIKRNNPNAIIHVVSSIKNYDYIKSFNFIDEVFLFKKGLLDRIKLINNLALLFEIPACLAIFETFLLLDEKTLEPAPKSVTSSIEVFNESSFL